VQVGDATLRGPTFFRGAPHGPWKPPQPRRSVARAGLYMLL